MKEYKTVEFESKDEFVEKKSRFIGYVKPVKEAVLYSFCLEKVCIYK